MKGINFGRVILGGIVAGILINISEFVLNEKVLKSDWDAALKAMGKSMTGDSAILVWILYGFVLGIAAVWLYAAIRPRYGAGAGTAARAGVAVWFFQSFLPTVAQANLALFPRNILMTSCVWALVELIIATVLGAWLYREAA
jgi:hypothetical protein